MTSEKLYGILKFIDGLDRKLELQKSLEQVGEALTSLTSQPANPQHQSSLVAALAKLQASVATMSISITPSQFSAIKAMGGEEFFDPGIFDKIKSSVQLNAMTPSVARDFVVELASRRSSFLSTIRSAKQALEGLNVKEAELGAGKADVAFLIPRDIFENKLGPFAKELGFINRLIEHYSEAVTGKIQTAEVEQLSSSVPTVALLAAIPVISLIATVVNKFLEAWERIEKIRKIRTELTEVGLSKSALDEVTEQITTTVNEVVEESTRLVLANYKGDGSRKNELENAVRQDTKRLFGQIERGLTVEFRAVAEEGGEDNEEQKMLRDIEGLGGTMEFPAIAKEPVMLHSGEVLEGEIVGVKQVRKSVQKTTTSKRTVHKDGGTEDPKGG
jgi:hypothetical protein